MIYGLRQCIGYSYKRIMQSVKGSFFYNFDRFHVQITPFSDKKLAITVTDPIQKVEYQNNMLNLNNIGTATLMKALQRNLIQVKMDMHINRNPQTHNLQIDVLVASQFLRPVEETLFVEKNRDISESELLKNAVESLSSKLKSLKDKQGAGPNANLKGTVQQGEKNYNNTNGYQCIGTIRLPKGKHIITLSFLLKATNQWLYIYFNQGQQFIQNCGFYVPNSGSFMPFTVRKMHTVNGDEEVINFNTYYAQTYPVVLRNIVLTAHPLN